MALLIHLPGDTSLPFHRVSGRLGLHFTYAPEAQRTRLAVTEQQPPLQLIRAFPLADGAALAHLHNISGGVLSGDQLELAVEVGPQAQAQLTSTGATRIYRQRAGLPPNELIGGPTAVQLINVKVAADGLLEYLPDPLIPFAGSRYRQQVKIELQPGAGLFWWETVSPGREALGERFEYERLELEFNLTAAGKPIALERLSLEPYQRPLTSPARLGPYRHFVSFYICRAGLESDRWLSLENRLAETAQALSQPGEVWWGASRLPAAGLVVRGLSLTGRALASGVITFWKIAKQELYGREAIPPRKLF